MQYSGKPDQVLQLDRSIRYCAVGKKLGSVLNSEVRANLNPLLKPEGFRKCALLAIRHKTRTGLEEKLGRAWCVVAYYEKVILASMELADNDLLLVTVDARAKNFQGIMRKVLGLIKYAQP